MAPEGRVYIWVYLPSEPLFEKTIRLPVKQADKQRVFLVKPAGPAQCRLQAA